MCMTLDWPVSIDDHPRPAPPPHNLLTRLYRRVQPPQTLMCIWLWQDGLTLETTSTLYEDASLSPWNGGADAIARHGMKWPYGAWQVDVLQAAGYTVTPCPDSYLPTHTEEYP